MAEQSEIVEIVELFEPITIASEQATGQGVLVPLPKQMIEEISESDNDPKFATFVIESGWSKSRRFWGEDSFERAQEQIDNSAGEPIVGYLGHIRPENDPYDFPDIQFQWLKSKLQKAGDKVRIFTKAYVLPDTKARYYLQRGLAKTVSWRGPCSLIPIKGGVQVRNFTLESIDLARPRAAGMSARLVGGLTSEMETEGSEVKPEEIAALQENELRAHNPSLVTAIEDAAKKPLTEKVGEMESEAETLKEDADLLPEIRKLFNMSDDANVLEVLGAAATNLKNAGKSVRNAIVDEVLAKKLKDEDTLKLVRRLVVAEMDSNHADLKLTGDKTADTKAVDEIVSEMIDKDNELKEMVSEMEETPRSVSNTGNDDRQGNDESKLKVGYSNSRIRVRSASR